MERIISDDRREDMIVGALEGGSNYWFYISRKEVKKVYDMDVSKEVQPFSTLVFKAIQAGHTIEIHDAEDNDTKLGEINLASIEKGERLMLENSKEHFAAILSEDDDASTADVWFQYCCLGEIVYG